jgi:hypothetical protein
MKNIQIKIETHQLLKEHCKENGLLMKGFIEKLIMNELNKNKKGTEVPNKISNL